MEIPSCPNWKNGSCPRSDPVVLACSVSEDYYQFGCRTCRVGYVVHTPRGAAKGRMEAAMKQQRSLTLKESDKKIFGMYTGSHRA